MFHVILNSTSAHISETYFLILMGLKSIMSNLRLLSLDCTTCILNLMDLCVQSMIEYTHMHFLHYFMQFCSRLGRCADRTMSYRLMRFMRSLGKAVSLEWPGGRQKLWCFLFWFVYLFFVLFLEEECTAQQSVCVEGSEPHPFTQSTLFCQNPTLFPKAPFFVYKINHPIHSFAYL